MAPVIQHVVRVQPGKTIFLLGALVYELIRLPITLTAASVPALRPLPQWTFRNTFMNYIARSLVIYSTYADTDNEPWDLSPGKEAARFQLIPSTDKAIYQDVLAPGPTKPCDVGGIWHPQSPSEKTLQELRHGSQALVLHFHGGAYARGTARDRLCHFAGANLSNSFGLALCGLYRLTSQGHAFPAALQDAATEYSWLVNELGVKPCNIILSGDSAGAHLAIALLRYIETRSDILPRPGAMLLWSPWVDAISAKSGSYDIPADLWQTDYLTREGMQTDVVKFIGSYDVNHAFINPVSHPFQTQVPVWVHAGSSEILYPSISRFVVAMQTLAGNNIHYSVSPYAMHDIFLTGWILGFREEAEHQVKAAAAFVKGTLA